MSSPRLNNIFTPRGDNIQNSKEFTNLNGYYLRIYNIDNDIYIISLDINSLDGVKYKIKINLDDIHELNDIFKNLSMQDIFKKFIKIINENQYNIEKKNDNLLLTLTVNNDNNIQEKKNIQFVLSNSNVTNEYFNILSNEIKKLKDNNNDLKKEIEKNKNEINELKKKTFQNNKESLNINNSNDNSILETNHIDLNINNINNINNKIKINNYKEDKLVGGNNYIVNNDDKKHLQNFNQKYKLDIKDNKINILDMSDKKVNDEFFINLNKLNLNQLKELYLYGNNLTNINELKNINLENLEILSLSNNNISDINVFKDLNCKNLKELWIYGNNITDINVLKEVKFNSLQKLSLNDNKIEDISILKDTNFKELKELILSHNLIKDINVLENVKFEKLKILSLNSNNIDNINIFEKTNFSELKILNLHHNNITDINVFKNVKFLGLEKLVLNNNKIEDINVFYKTKFIKLKELWLNNNNIKNINVFDDFNYDTLEILYLHDNEIKKENYIITISLLKKYINDFKI